MKAHYSSKAHDWQTPPALFADLDARFRFTLDAAASAENAKCARYFTREDNGLAQSWAGERVWLNPPYGREIGAWVRKAWRESRRGALVVCLIPARTDTSYWHDYAMRAAEILLIRGRVRFLRPGALLDNAPFPSALVVFDPAREGPPAVRSFSIESGQLALEVAG